MDLTRFATPRPFVVSAADGTRDRLAVEAEMRARGWRPALSPAETGMLVVCGNPGADLADAIDTVWRDMPEPRVRASADLEWVAGGARPALELDDVYMADRGDDRDGLRLDVLHVPLGPVLANWPAGLRVDLTLQGDVVQAAEVTAVDTADGTFWHEGRWAASRLDSVSRLLRVAGWDAAGERVARSASTRSRTSRGSPSSGRRCSARRPTSSSWSPRTCWRASPRTRSPGSARTRPAPRRR